jgi:hypothetical protein
MFQIKKKSDRPSIWIQGQNIVNDRHTTHIYSTSLGHDIHINL